MDGLSEILEAGRLRSTVFSKAVLGAPWSVDSGPLRSGVFHAVVEGAATLVVGEQTLTLTTGSAVFLPHGARHVMTSDPELEPTPARELTQREHEGSVPTMVLDGGGGVTRLICGSIRFEHSEAHPLLSILPSAIRVHASADNASWLQSSIRLIDHELSSGRPGSNMLVARLSDVLLVNALRHWVSERGAEQGAGWIRGLCDAQIAKALTCVHQEPATAWTVESLARASGMSRSAFAARFSELVGESPSRYLTRWRMHLAAKALRERRDTMAEIAESVGYASEHAFSKAFKRTLGMTPSAFRAG